MICLLSLLLLLEVGSRADVVSRGGQLLLAREGQIGDGGGRIQGGIVGLDVVVIFQVETRR